MRNKILTLLVCLLLLHCADAQNSLVISIFTGGDDLRTNSIAEGIIDLQDNSHLTIALNRGVGWGGGSQNTVEYLLPTGVDPSQFTGFTLTFRSGSSGAFDTGDNWNVDRISIAYQSRSSSGGFPTSSYSLLAQRSGTPWVRFDGVSVRGRGYIPINYQVPPPTTASVNVTGINRVQNVSSGKFLAIGGGSLNNGAFVIQWENANQLDIQWDFVPEGGNIYRIRNLNSGRFLAIEGGSRTNGARALQWSDDGQADVFWELVNLGSGVYKIRNRNSGLFLSLNGGSQNGVNIVQRQDGTQNTLQWRIQAVTPFMTLELRGFQVFNDCNFGGAPISISEGYHRTLPAGVPNDAISAVRATNLRITLYEHSDFRGNCVVLPFGVPVPCLVAQDFNDKASSLITTRQ